MQEDKVLHTEKVSAGKRTYFLDLKEDQRGSKILKITESRKNDGQFIRHSVLIFQEDFKKIFDALELIKGQIGPLEDYVREREPGKETDEDLSF
ncbi:MAG: DUF3276 family protein [Bacteroidetes bacterium]|nr:DUF3276 family protein [Bacteroidota bacterium]MBK8657783.1 DUF3276 family protein [Bacteroidota bacterium]